MQSSSIFTTAYYSLIVQIIIGILCFYGLQKKLASQDQILHDILLLESVVQVIEFTFYVALVLFFTKNVDVTKYRYMDWAITTPTMLLSIVLFMIYTENRGKKKIDFKDTVKKNKKPLAIIFVTNLLMLFFGFLGEIKKLDKTISFTLGFTMFSICYYTIYKHFLGTTKINSYLFYITFVIWSLYGVASLLPYITKNVSYNILDIFSKNMNGLFIALYVIYFATSKK